MVISTYLFYCVVAVVSQIHYLCMLAYLHTCDIVNPQVYPLKYHISYYTLYQHGHVRLLNLMCRHLLVYNEYADNAGHS